MLNYIEVIIGMLIGILMAVVCLNKFLKYNYSEQEIAINGKMKRREKGAFIFEEYIEENKLEKDKEWLKQKNGGVDPKMYNKGIKYKNHFMDCEYIVSKKGL